MTPAAVRSAMHLAKHAVRDMSARGEGRILFSSSIAATHPDPLPGPTGTEFIDRVGMDETKIGTSDAKTDPASSPSPARALNREEAVMAAGTIAARMLEAYPRDFNVDRDALARCIEAC